LSHQFRPNTEGEYTQFDASDIWRVQFSAPLPAAVGRASLVNIDSFSTPGKVSHFTFYLIKFAPLFEE
jgi:hypothetical protein